MDLDFEFSGKVYGTQAGLTPSELTRPQSLALDQRLTRERAYSPVLKYNEGLWKSQPSEFDLAPPP